MPKVLLIDDDPNLRHILSRALGKSGFDVVLAEDGATGLQAARDEQPDLIILDIIMPGMDGFEVAQQLHRDPVCARIPIMVLTAYATPYGRKIAVDIGVDDYVTKPFGLDDIVSKVKAMTSKPSKTANEPTVPLKATAQAQTICLHSLRGGLGSTSLAISLAASLRNLWRLPTLLLDADFNNGQMVLALGWPQALPEALSWSDLIKASLEKSIDKLLESKLVDREDGLDVLIAPRNAKDAHRISAKVVSYGLRMLKQPYDYIVADLAHDLRDNTLELVRGADKVLHLFAADVVSIRLAEQAITTYMDQGVQPENVLPVLVDTRPGRPVRIGVLERALGRPLAAYIPYEKQMTEAVNRRLPFVSAFPDHRMTRLIEDLAYLLSQPVHASDDKSMPSPAYKRARARVVAATPNGAALEIGEYMLNQAGIER